MDDKLGGFLTRQFQVAAFRVLGENGRPRDVEFGRRFADSEDQQVRREALRLLQRFGTSHDAAKAEHADPLLSFYMRHRHFYNVVRAVDRRLSASEWLEPALPHGD